ncbi:MAG: hypothetical protein CL920_07785 [Deltaproteobacteria bacterium]|nr:hypothetical protein [Deltaproteobacteria bacterium]MBU48580.1 hypothetical protein [Deltaproteobacteria bacterium]
MNTPQEIQHRAYVPGLFVGGREPTTSPALYADRGSFRIRRALHPLSMYPNTRKAQQTRNIS